MTPRDDPFTSPNPHRLYRNPEQGYVFGVCAGIADFFGIDVGLVRLAAVLGGLFFFFPVVPAYLLAAAALPRKPPQLYRSRDEEAFWRAVSTRPDQTLSGLRHRFRELERRLNHLEGYVASQEFELNRAINDLDR